MTTLASQAAIRDATRRARLSLTLEQRASASRAAVERLRRLTELTTAHVVALYAPTPEEIDPSELVSWLHDRDVRTLFPRVRGDGGLDLVEVSDLTALRLGYRGIQEPPGPPIDPSVVDVAILPGVAFDPHGGRLGMGGGHFDRLLAQLEPDAVAIGICFANQVVPQIPRQEHDRGVHIVVTDRAIYRAPPVSGLHPGTG